MEIYRPRSPTGFANFTVPGDNPPCPPPRSLRACENSLCRTRRSPGFASYLRCNFRNAIYTLARAHVFEFNGVGIFVEFLFFFFQTYFLFGFLHTGRARARAISLVFLTFTPPPSPPPPRRDQ